MKAEISPLAKALNSAQPSMKVSAARAILPSCRLQVAGYKFLAPAGQPATFNMEPATAGPGHETGLRLHCAVLLAVSLLVIVPDLNALAAGTVVFNNNSSCLIINGQTTNPVSAGDNVHAALYWAPMGSNSFVQVGSNVNVGTPVAGAFAGGTRTTGTNTAGGDSAQFQVRAWSGSDTSYENALLHAGVLVGQSAILQLQTGDPGGSPPRPPPSLAGPLTSFTLLPNTPVLFVPVLYVSRSGGSLTLFWTTNAVGFLLEQNNDLTLNNWSFAGSPAVIGSNNTVFVPLGTGNNFYRLRHP